MYIHKVTSKVVLWLLLIGILSGGCTVGRFFAWNFADIKDYKKFPTTPLDPPDNAFEFIDVVRPIRELTLPQQVKVDDESVPFESALEQNKTVYFAVIQRDSLLYEQWFNGYNEQSTVTSFSVVKSFVSALVGFAVADGAIQSVQDPIGKYLPEMRDAKMREVTIEQVLNMASGVDFNESYYSPFGHAAKFYYGRQLERNAMKLKRAKAPGMEFEYRSGNTVLLALIIQRATGMALNEYMTQKIWKPLGMEREATLSTDSKKNNQAKAFAGLNGHPRDFGRFGRLYLNRGNWNGEQILPKSWVEVSTRSQMEDSIIYYSYQWWMEPRYIPLADTSRIEGPFVVEKSGFLEADRPVDYAMIPANDYAARGHLGQFIYVHPEKEMIILRFGKKPGKIDWMGLCRDVAELN